MKGERKERKEGEPHHGSNVVKSGPAYHCAPAAARGCGCGTAVCRRSCCGCCRAADAHPDCGRGYGCGCAACRAPCCGCGCGWCCCPAIGLGCDCGGSCTCNRAAADTTARVFEEQGAADGRLTLVNPLLSASRAKNRSTHLDLDPGPLPSLPPRHLPLSVAAEAIAGG